MTDSKDDPIKRLRGSVQKYTCPTESAVPIDEWDAHMSMKDLGEDISRLAVKVLGSNEKATEWLSSSVPALGNQRPIDLCGTPEGKHLVNATLRKIEAGDFS